MTPAVPRLPRLAALWLALLLALPAWPGLAQRPESPTLGKIRDTGVIVLGYRSESMPFSYLDARRQPIGYSMDLCHRIVDAVKQRLNLRDLEVKRVAVTSATRIPLLANGSVDLECGVTTNTVERQKSVAFSVTTFVAASRLLARKSSRVRTIDDLRGQSVVSTLATTSIQYLTEVNRTRQLDMKILAGLDDADAFRMVQSDRAVAFAMDDVLLRAVLANAADADDYSVSEAAVSIEPYGIGMSRDDPAFKRLADDVIIEIYRSGDIHAIYRKWFQSPVPPRGINLQLPMSESFQRVIQHPTDTADPQAYR